MKQGEPEQVHADAPAEVEFAYEGQSVMFRSVGTKDHILGVMRSHNTFYEVDVLEGIRNRLRNRARGAAVDVGAFIGTHSTYFARFCDLNPVIAFEANADTFPFLKHNVAVNRLNETVIPIKKALGAGPGYALVNCSAIDNQGGSTVSFIPAARPDSVEVSTVDLEVEALTGRISNVALMKIDVEGAELAVLEGALRTIADQRPILCIEVHTTANLRKVVSLLEEWNYWVIDCLGYSPTYILEPTTASSLRKALVHFLWFVRAGFLAGQLTGKSLMSWYLKRIAQALSAGR